MIRRLVVSNFRSLGEDVVLRPGPLTVLVGPNGSGKSNVADVFRFIAESIRVGLEAAITKRQGISALRRWSTGHLFDLKILVEVAADGMAGSYEFVLGGDRAQEYRVKREAASVRSGHGRASYVVDDGAWRDGPPGLAPKVDAGGLALPLVAADERFRPLADTLRDMAIYSIFPDTLRDPQKPDPTRPMDEHGANWTSVLRGLRGETWEHELRAALGKVTGDIVDVRVRQVGGYLVAEFLHVHGGDRPTPRRRERWFAAAQESDGTLRIAGILTALLQEPPLALVGVEEPELTVHPGAIPLLYDYLREASQRSQVMVTTHSPDLLGLLDPDEVRVVERHAGVTSVAPLEASQRDAVRDRLLSLEEVLRLEGLRQGPVEQLPAG